MTEEEKKIPLEPTNAEPTWESIGEMIIKENGAQKYAENIRQMAKIAGTVRNAQLQGCTILDLKTGKCREDVK